MHRPPAGKLTHSGAAQLAGSDYSLADYNRAGVPLLEIVSEPDLRTGAEAAAYGAEIRRIVRFIGAGNGNMQVSPSPRPMAFTSPGSRFPNCKNLPTIHPLLVGPHI